MRHYPVLLEEAIEYLSIDPEGVYVDCTFGEGGHSEAILQRLTTGRLIALDRDRTALEAGRERLAEYRDKLTLIHSNYSNLAEFVATPVRECWRMWDSRGGSWKMRSEVSVSCRKGP